MPRLFLHIGTHKTGSTVLQQTFRANSRLLAQRGIKWLPPFPNVRTFTRQTAVDESFIQSYRQYLRQRVDRAKQGTHRYLMSYEGFSGDPWTGYKNVGAIATMLNEVTAEFNPTIIVYLRRQDEFVESFYIQTIQGGRSWSFEEFLGQTDASWYCWESLVGSYARLFGRESIVVRRYGKSFLPEKDSLLRDFVDVLGIGPCTFKRRPSWTNTSQSPGAVELARLCNPHLTPEEQHQFRLLLQTASPRQPLTDHRYFRDDQRHAFLERYAGSNTRVAREYCGEEELFPPPLEISTEQPEMVTADRAPIVLARTLLLLDRRLEVFEQRSWRSLPRRIRDRVRQGLRRLMLWK